MLKGGFVGVLPVCQAGRIFKSVGIHIEDLTRFTLWGWCGALALYLDPGDDEVRVAVRFYGVEGNIPSRLICWA